MKTATKDPTTKRYPTTCISMYCGKSGADCHDCPDYPHLEAFNEWKERTNAVCVDEVWSPLVYTARR
jgi:hypothetical protein